MRRIHHRPAHFFSLVLAHSIDLVPSRTCLTNAQEIQRYTDISLVIIEIMSHHVSASLGKCVHSIEVFSLLKSTVILCTWCRATVYNSTMVDLMHLHAQEYHQFHRSIPLTLCIALAEAYNSEISSLRSRFIANVNLIEEIVYTYIN
jgi:hypothetical protein